MNPAIAFSCDLERPKLFLVLRKGMEPSYVDEMEVEYRRFLACVASNRGEGLPISNPVDEMWHSHILFTREYIKMSEYLIGRYLNHIPTLSEDERAALEPRYFNGTLKLYERLFGEKPPKKFWPLESGSICWSKGPEYL